MTPRKEGISEHFVPMTGKKSDMPKKARRFAIPYIIILITKCRKSKFKIRFQPLKGGGRETPDLIPK